MLRLRELGGEKTTAESGIAYHDGRQIQIPRGMTLKAAAKLLAQQAQSEEEIHNFQHIFKFRPWDGAYALQEVLKENFGLSGQGKAIVTFFGTNPPEYRSIEIAPGQFVDVPWGQISFSPFEGTFHTGAIQDPTYGHLFHVQLHAPKKHRAAIEGLWYLVEEYLKNRSIYKGKAIFGIGKATRDGFEQPEFINPYVVEKDKIVFNAQTQADLEDSVWGPIKNADAMRAIGETLGLKSLLSGPYGTGKSSALAITAQVCVEHGWTYLQVKSGQVDELKKVMKTAELYAPALVAFEDIDNMTKDTNVEMSDLLEMFDGVSSKGKEVMVLMTSNRADTLNKGMSRPGRIDSMIEISDLDREGIERLIKSVCDPESLSDDIDFDAIFEAMDGYAPAFIKGTFSRTRRNAVIRTGVTTFVLETQDFVRAANSLRNQSDIHTNALDKPTMPELEGTLRKIMADEQSKSLQGHKVNLQNEGELITLD